MGQTFSAADKAAGQDDVSDKNREPIRAQENGTKFETKNRPPMSALLSGILRPVLSFGKIWDFENSRAH